MSSINPIIDSFETFVKKMPEATVVILGEQSLSYLELSQRVNQLCAELQKSQISPDMQIGLCMERSFEQIIAILAILKAGGAYVPLDPLQPLSRLEYIIREGAISTLILSPKEQKIFKKFKGRIVVMKSSAALASHTNYPIAKISVNPEDLAYVIYTSGTTGSPKGVMIEQHSVMNYTSWFASYAGVRVGQRIDWSGNYIFDMTVSTSIVPLMLGMTIVMCADKIKNNPRAYLSYINENNVNIIKISPSYFKALLQEVRHHPVALDTLEGIILGGERLLTSDCQEWLNLYPHQILYNEYGPTETTVAVTQQKITKQNINEFPLYIPIGKSGANMFCYLLDSELKQVSKGEKAELYIGGGSLARGYTNQPLLTEKKFIPSPFPNNPGDKLYKTGDLCCLLPDDSIEFFGRIDSQIKLRGYRIEPGEIESHLRHYPSIQDALVLLYDEDKETPYLIAYCIPKKGKELPNYIQMRKYLQQYLPIYMVPKTLIEIDKFPLTTNSKLDFNALPLPTEARTHRYTEPRTTLEKKIASIWSKELNISLVGIHDNFFELGGHSLHAARIVSEIHLTLNKNISLVDFFHEETIAHLAKKLRKKTFSLVSVRDNAKRIEAVAGYPKKIPLGDFQLFLWILKTVEPSARKLNLVSRKRFAGDVNFLALDEAFKSVLKRHDILNYHIKAWYPAHYQKKNSELKIQEHNLSTYTGLKSEELLKESLYEMMNFNAWSKQHPQILVSLFYLPKGLLELQICLPHLISDDVSLDILWNDVSKFYHESTYEKKQVLKKNQIASHSTFADYIDNEKTIIENNFDSDCVFWANYLDNTYLPSFPSSQIIKNIEKKGLAYSTYQKISQKWIVQLEQYCSTHQLALNAVLCAAVSLAMRKITENNDANDDKSLLMNIVKSTRNNRAWDETIGCFLRIDPIKVNCHQDGDNLLSVANQIHQDMIKNTKHLEASSILKLAYMKAKTPKKKWNFLLKILVMMYTKFLKILRLNYKSLQLIAELALFNRKKEYVICINLRNNFTALPQKDESLSFLGKKEKETVMLHYDLEKFDNVCDISFIRDDSLKTAYVVVSSNLQPEFREKIAKEIIRNIRKGMTGVVV